jgi:hypothetical protein
MDPIVRNLYLAVSLTMLMAGCSNTSDDKQPETKMNNTGAWDADSRNNENPSLGAKNLSVNPRPTTKRPTLDPTAAHLNSGLQMNRDAGRLIVRMARVPDAFVAVTNNHVYVAVDPDGQRMMMQLEQSHTFQHDPAAGAGLFGSGVGSQMDWTSAKPLPKAASETIFNVMRDVFPGGNVYISTNRNFVNRMQFYELQQQKRQTMGPYLNEFNTMVQYVFPEFGNGTNRMLSQ